MEKVLFIFLSYIRQHALHQRSAKRTENLGHVFLMVFRIMHGSTGSVSAIHAYIFSNASTCDGEATLHGALLVQIINKCSNGLFPAGRLKCLFAISSHFLL